jgi:acetylglutamate kinase
MDKLIIVKIGGNIIDDEKKLSSFLKSFASVAGNKILVHGGGKLATKLAEQLNIPQQMVEGRRITDAETLNIITMVYAGKINKNIVASLQSNHCNAIGLSGADGNAILAHKRIQSSIDYGFAGDIDKVNTHFFKALLQEGLSPVIAPLTHDGNGQLLNTNADTMAQEIARALCKTFETVLIYSFEKAGVLLDIKDEKSVISQLTAIDYYELKSNGVISEGMIPKLDNAFKALENGISKVIIGKAEDLHQLIKGEQGTTISTY